MYKTPVFIHVDLEGRITITEDELRKIIEAERTNAYREGYNQGLLDGIREPKTPDIPYVPSTPITPGTPWFGDDPNWWRYSPTCTTGTDLKHDKTTKLDCCGKHNCEGKKHEE